MKIYISFIDSFCCTYEYPCNDISEFEYEVLNKGLHFIKMRFEKYGKEEDVYIRSDSVIRFYKVEEHETKILYRVCSSGEPQRS